MANRLLAAAGLAFLMSAPASATPLWQESAIQAKSEKSTTLPDFTRMARHATEAVVSISTVQQSEGDDPIKSLLDPSSAEPQKGLGSGFFINPDGYFVTNAHVVEGATELIITVRRGERTEDFRAHVIGMDTPTDSALLRVDAEAGAQFPFLVLGDSDKLEVAEWIAAIGNPYGLSYSVTVGVISYLGRNDVMPAGRDGYYDYIQTDASINPGNSGGPILNTRGEVVGIANAVNAVGQGIGFAIPINMLKQVLSPLLKDGKVQRSWIGVSVEDITPTLARDEGLPANSTGVYVSDVVEGSPGAKAGLKAGDVITSFDGAPVGQAQRLRWLAASSGVGKQVTIGVQRAGRDSQVSAKLAAMPEDEEEPNFPQPVEVGLELREVEVPAARAAGLALPMGAQVANVKPGSAAEKAGVKPGDLILKIDAQTIQTPVMVSRAFAKVHSGGVANLVLKRQAETVFMPVKKP